MPSTAQVLSALERAVKRANVQSIPEGSFTREDFQAKVGMSLDTARRFLKKEVQEGRLAMVQAIKEGKKLNFYYEPGN